MTWNIIYTYVGCHVFPNQDLYEATTKTKLPTSKVRPRRRIQTRPDFFRNALKINRRANLTFHYSLTDGRPTICLKLISSLSKISEMPILLRASLRISLLINYRRRRSRFGQAKLFSPQQNRLVKLLMRSGLILPIIICGLINRV